MSESNKLLKALQLEHDDDWENAHKIVQEIESNMSYQIHAYLHRVEGDLSNARYWYNRAGVSAFNGDLKSEWDMLFDDLKNANID